MTSSKCRHTTL